MPDSPPRGALSRRAARALATTVALLYLVPAFLLLGDHGPTVDCVRGEYPYGERVLEYLLSGDARFLQLRLDEPRPGVREPHPDFAAQRFPWSWVPPFVATLSAVGCRLLWGELGWLPPIAAHHAIIVLMVAGLLWGWTRFLATRLGGLAALGAALALLCLPRFVAHSFNNLKDAPEAALYVGACVLGYLALTRGQRRWWILSGVVTAMALAHRPNALFLPVQGLLFFVLVRLGSRGEAQRAGDGSQVRVTRVGLTSAALAFIVVYYLVSPPYWIAPLEGPREVFDYMFHVGVPEHTSQLEQGRPWWSSISLHKPKHVLWTTPPVLLILASIGLLRRGPSWTLRAFLYAGLAVPLARFLIPGMRNYGGVRHILEFFPFLGAFVGLGLATLTDGLVLVLDAWGWRHPRRAPRVAAGLALMLGLLPAAWQVWATYPNGISYFNLLVGGQGGAQARRLREATDNLRSSYWQGLAWFDREAPQGAQLFVPGALPVAQAIWELGARPDLRLLTQRERPRGTSSFVLFTTDLRGPLRAWIDAETEVVHAISVQGADILRIAKLPADAQHAPELRAYFGARDERRAAARAARELERVPGALERAFAVGHAYRAGEVGLGEAVGRLRDELQGDGVDVEEAGLGDATLEALLGQLNRAGDRGSSRGDE